MKNSNLKLLDITLEKFEFLQIIWKFVAREAVNFRKCCISMIKHMFGCVRHFNYNNNF